MRKFTSIHWVMALFIAAISLCSVLPGQHVRASEFSPVGEGSLFAATEENNPYSYLQTPGLISTASGESEVRFEYEPGPIGYQSVYKNYESFVFSSYTVMGNPSSVFKVRVQLKDKTQANDVRFVTDNNNSLTLTDGGFWFPAEEIRQEDKHFFINFRIGSSKAIEVDYTVSLYQSEDLTTKPMASSERKIVFVAGEDYPVLPSPPSLRGELNTVVPYTFSIEPGFLQGKAAIVRLDFDNVNMNKLVVSGEGWQQSEYWNGYEYRIDRLTQDKITVNFKATGQIGGRYGMILCDGEGNSVVGSRNAVLQFPANLSNDDQQALKALMEDNPESTELRDFIETGLYKKDTNLNETSEKVAVRWNDETPARVSDFRLEDADIKVSTLNLNALKGLKTVLLRGTNLKTMDLSSLTLSSLSLFNTPLKWGDVKLPNWTDEYHSLYGYTTIPFDNPSVKKGAEIDLSEFAQVDGTASTFTWFEYNRSEAPKQVELTQTSPGKFILNGENGQRFYCAIKNERYRDWIMRTPNLICTASGGPVVRFAYEPDSIGYRSVYKNYESSFQSSYTVESIPSSAFKVRVQLKDQTQANDIRLGTENIENLTLTDGGFWLPAEEIRQKGDGYFSFYFRIISSKAVEVDYTVSLYQSEDLTTKPMASSERKVIFMASEDFPVMPSLPSLRGELKTDVPYTFSIKPGFLQGKPAIVRLYFMNVNLDNLVVSGAGWQKNEYRNGYEYRIDRLTQDKITVNFKATRQIGGRYDMELCDGEGNPVVGTRKAVLQFPANLSNDDQQALKAMQEDNPESKELRDFIETGRYKKDIDIHKTTEKVAVTWNAETPSRVSDLLLRDEDRKVSTLNLNALKGLEAVELQGTNLKKLDLSNLTLSSLGLINTPLKWSDVKLPNWAKYHGLYGHTEIQLNPSVKKGEVIDLSEFAQVDGIASTFSWFEWNRSEGSKPVKLASPSPGMFIFDGEIGQQFYCEIRNERYGDWVLVTSQISIVSGEPNATFIRLPNAKDYTSFGGVDQPGEGLKFANINIYATSKSDFRVRVQLKDKTNKNGTWFTINDKVMPLTDGGFWVPEELVSCYDTNKYAFGMVVHSPNPIEETYTVSLYRSEDLSTEPMGSGERTIVFIADEEYPRFGKLPDLHGELNTAIPLTFSIDPRYMKGKAARLVLSLDTLSANNMTVKGEGWKPSEKYKGNYVYDTDNLQQTQFTLYVTASNPVDGGYSVTLCDDKGVGVAYSIDSAAAPTIKIPSASGEPEMRFWGEPAPIEYETVYKGYESSAFSSYSVVGNPSSPFKVRVQLKNQAQANDIRFETDDINNKKKDLPLTDGGFWFPSEEIRKEDEYFFIDFNILSSKVVEVDYTVSLYQSEDLTTEPMASTEKKVVFVAEEDYPVLPSRPNLRGELKTDVPYTFSIKPGFLQGKAAIARLVFENVDMNNLVVSGEGWQKSEYWNGYEYRIDRLTQDKITANFRASGQIGGWYLMDLCDGGGNPVVSTYNAVLQFPANLSDDDRLALEAMMVVNPESSELRDFIETGRYKKDINVLETAEKVAVTWNDETPARVSDFLLRDDDRKVSTLNLNALKGLTTVRLQGTNLKTLDLSGLTLRVLRLINTPLKWSDVKLPKWTEYGYFLDGTTSIQLDSTIMKGAEIDLSEFAQVDTVASTFSWFECDGSKTGKPVELVSPAPGKFTLDGEIGQQFYCKIENERYEGWILQTTVVTVGDPVIHFSQQDVKVLEKLVKDANDLQLNEWWESKAWQGFEMINGAQVLWNDENPRRLTALWILQAELSETVDLSTLDRLEILSLMGYNKSKLTKLILPTEKALLSLLNVAGNKKLTSLDVTSYANLNHLDVSGTGLEACDVSKNTKLEVLYMQKTKIPGLEATAPEIAKQLVAYGVPNGNETIDLDLFPALKKLIPNKHMRYSDVKHPRQMDSLDYDWVNSISLPGDAYDPNYSSYGHTMDISEWYNQDGVTVEPVWAIFDPFTGETDTLSHTGMTYTIGKEIEPEMEVYAEVHNKLFPRWTLRYTTQVYTMDGDVNLDRAVDVKDVTSLISSLLHEWPSDRIFGWTQANTNHDEYYGDAADLVGLVNIILGKPVTKGEALRAAYIPQAELSVDERNNLYIDHEAPISALYLEFAGATKELALTGDAARMTQSRSLQNDTLRIVAYSMDGKSIATGKQALMQLAPGMQLTKASFSDAKAVPLKLVGDYLPTANETIAPFDEVKAVYNYPNPASGTTTFCYSLSEDANSVEIELIASNGAVVARLQGLPTAQGRHEENVSLPFGNGVYFYRLVLNGKQIVATNTLIIK